MDSSKMDLSISKAIDMNSRYLGIETIVLMENAGKEIASHSRNFDSIAIFAGLGNNGGDGLVAARHLSGMGKRVRVYTFKGNRTEESQKNLEIIENMGIEIRFINDSKDCESIRRELDEFDLIIDALVGVGVKGELREPLKSIVEMINSSTAFKLAVDVPTPGLNSDKVISFHFPKVKNAIVADIGIPREAETYCGPGDVYLAIPERIGTEHKGDFGRLLIVGGSREFSKTPELVALAAYRTGVDLCTICCPSYVSSKIFNPNIIVKPLDSEYYIDKGDIKEILKTKFDSMVIGNGLGTENETKYAIRKLLKNINTPVVIDADALKLIKKKHLNERTIITPHEGEFRILCNEFDIKLGDRIESAKKLSEETNAIVVLKGKTDIIACKDRVKLNKTGNPGMSVGGTGDVLAGIIGALSCRSNLFYAACAGAFLCGLAGDLAYEEYGYYFTATDVIERIPNAIKFCKKFE
ncbi:MAG: bifunctional ADP-dependent NAD(P)H-hydrate dehydratase/NAD(P)H-hydrate epimerase [Candidatus Altiarchaeales archaeon]|nr:MAG: bifunctional ADP-dependent NAD(P)H-hydrate dehydratase/NAD(P)H-hydrate epimerase [Candidatus Altiarchaeales archaeon]